MVLTLMLLAGVTAIAFAERSVQHFLFAISALLVLTAGLMFVVADVERAILLTSILVTAIIGASIVKHTHSGLKLLVTDFPLMFAGTAPFFAAQYPGVVIAALAGGLLLVLAAIATLVYGAGAPISLEWRILLFGLALPGFALAHRMSGGAPAFRRTTAQRQGFLSTFMASLIDTISWRQSRGFALSDIAEVPLPLMAAVPGCSVGLPDILVIQHESIFDPRVFGLPVEGDVAEFLSPRNGLHGALNVDIFGGGSWQTEFSLLTGLSSASFGSNSYYLFRRGVGRFKHTLPHALAAIGYKTMLTSSCRRNFLNYDEFYGAIGMDERIFTDDFPPPFDHRQFEATNSDALFLEAAVGVFEKRIAVDTAPRFLYALTNFNHGPHTRRLIPAGQHERERAFALASVGDAQYAEYYARLAETAAAWQRLKDKLTRDFPTRPMLIVHYGDHQPVMTRRIEQKLKLRADAQRQFRTFYAMEWLNVSPDQLPSGRGADLDIAFLGTVILQQAGLPLDPIFATRASLIDECGNGYFASPSERKRRFHRTLVDLGMVNVAPQSSHRPINLG